MRLLFLLFFSLLPALVQAQPVMLSGNLSSAGSDTLGYLMTLWGDDFSRQSPGVNVQVQASGSSTAPTALTAGSVQLGAMSRPMQADERQAFEARYGYPPLAVPVAMDALVVVVNQRNPLTSIDPHQLDALFSVTRLCGARQVPERWGDLGLHQAEWQQRSIQRYGRNSASGTWGFFKQQALCQGDFRNDVAEFPGSAAVVQAVAGDPRSIGYASFGFHLSGVKLLPVITKRGKPLRPILNLSAAVAIPGHVRSICTLIKCQVSPCRRCLAAFLEQVLSSAGQQRVIEAGYLPLSETQMNLARASLR
ncbi:SphX [Pantoea ananatis LMG 20103]|uniref:SphX n=1 Tax=Pantoea ananatis (strain LMG 20103) TaxID=706191 RepID=D4GL76_PANAM|nr:PstS family phosphate ABC transporter substrate-binding protein [Pantoea ananatis]ADD76122.1 SphX [Pantoea ananatis LMG 20103]